MLDNTSPDYRVEIEKTDAYGPILHIINCFIFVSDVLVSQVV